MKHLDITIKGNVQGVFFRASAKAVADILGIRGHAMNLKNGDVFIEAEGADFVLNEFLKFCEEGPEGAMVAEMQSTESEMKNYKHFEIKKK